MFNILTFTPQVNTPTSPPPPPPPPPPVLPDCDEIGRVSKAYASAHYRTRIHAVRLMSGESRCLVAEFSGAISASRSIASVVWRCDMPSVARMANARIQSNGTSSAVDLTAGYPGTAIIRCEATLDNGEVYVQPFHVAAMSDPLFISTAAAGPLTLTAVATV